MRSRAELTRTRALSVCLFSALVILACAGLFAAAALVPAPPGVLPLVIAVCVGGPMLAAWELRGALAALRARKRMSAPMDSTAIASLREHLERLPETQHPLGL